MKNFDEYNADEKCLTNSVLECKIVLNKFDHLWFDFLFILSFPPQVSLYLNGNKAKIKNAKTIGRMKEDYRKSQGWAIFMCQKETLSNI